MTPVRNEYLFPLDTPRHAANLPTLETALVEALQKRRGQIVSAFAIAENGDTHEVARFPVWWPTPGGRDTNLDCVRERVAALALHYAREGALLRGFT